jgi:hypothetical protein
MYFWECARRDEFQPFLTWLNSFEKTQFPVSFYLNGITYTMKNQDWASLFIVGIHAAMDAEDYERIY